MSNLLRLTALALLTTGCAASTGGRSWHAPAGFAVEGEHAAEDGAEHGAGAQTVNLFLGGSSDIGDADGFTIGLDYEYRLSDDWGIGGFAESIAGLHRSSSLGAQAYWHVAGELILVAGPGIERRGGEWEPIVRIGGFYEFPLEDGWLLSPGIFYDFTEDQNLLIYGLSLGYSF